MTATYISLITYTDEGRATIKEAPRRIDLARAYLSDLGGKLRDFYLTLGEYDLVVIFEVPDDRSAAKFLLSLDTPSRVTTRTMKAFGEGEFREILQEL